MEIRVILLEDDFDLAETIVQFLELEKIICDHAANGEAGMTLIRKNHYDILVLDVMLPRMDGLQVCRTMRREGLDMPVLMLTAKDTLRDKLVGFEAGTDDYLVKPFDVDELIARIRVLAKRRSGQARRFTVGDLVMDIEQHEVWRKNAAIHLTPTEWHLLETLIRAYPGVVSREELVYAVWGNDIPETNNLKVHIHTLRRQVDKPFKHKLIRTIPGHGVVLKTEPESFRGPNENRI